MSMPWDMPYDNGLRDFGLKFVEGYHVAMTGPDLIANAPFEDCNGLVLLSGRAHPMGVGHFYVCSTEIGCFRKRALRRPQTSFLRTLVRIFLRRHECSPAACKAAPCVTGFVFLPSAFCHRYRLFRRGMGSVAALTHHQPALYKIRINAQGWKNPSGSGSWSANGLRDHKFERPY
jgi:hypothetical protein